MNEIQFVASSHSDRAELRPKSKGKDDESPSLEYMMRFLSAFEMTNTLNRDLLKLM